MKVVRIEAGITRKTDYKTKLWKHVEKMENQGIFIFSPQKAPFSNII
jgi:biotin operon repressor